MKNIAGPSGSQTRNRRKSESALLTWPPDYLASSGFAAQRTNEVTTCMVGRVYSHTASTYTWLAMRIDTANSKIWLYP